MNAPLWFTSVRIVAIPPLMVLLLVDGIPGARWWAFAVFAVACVTDSIDGWLARSRGEVTVAGAFLDPLADKLLISAVLVSLVETGEVAAWVAMVIIAREFAVTGLRLVAAARTSSSRRAASARPRRCSQNVALGRDHHARASPAGSPTSCSASPWSLTVLSGAHYFLIARWRLFSGKTTVSADAVEEP